MCDIYLLLRITLGKGFSGFFGALSEEDNDNDLFLVRIDSFSFFALKEVGGVEWENNFVADSPRCFSARFSAACGSMTNIALLGLW